MKKRLISAIMASAIAATTLSPVFAEDNTISMSYSNGQLMINSSQLSKGTLIYSEYENGRLTNVKLYKDISFEKNTFTIEAEEGDKFILVDSIDKMQPLCDSITVSKDIPTPTEEPTSVPTEEPTLEPTATVIPTDSPTATPTATPVPTYTPSPSPTVTPTSTPSPTPTVEQTKEPTATPTSEPTSTPTEMPTEIPTEEPTATPSPTPTAAPTEEPTTTLERYITFTGDETTYYNIKVAIDVTTVSNTPKKVTAIDSMPEGYKVTGVLLSDNKLMVSVMKDDVLVAIVEATEEPVTTPEPTFTPSPEPTEEPTDVPTEAPTEEPTDAPTEEPIETPGPDMITVLLSYYGIDNTWAEGNQIYMKMENEQIVITEDFVNELAKNHDGYEFYRLFTGYDEESKITELPTTLDTDGFEIVIYIEYQKKATPTPEPTATPSPTPTAEPTATPSPTPTAKPTMEPYPSQVPISDVVGPVKIFDDKDICFTYTDENKALTIEGNDEFDEKLFFVTLFDKQGTKYSNLEKYRDIFNKAEVLNINGGVTKLSRNLLVDIVTLIPNLKEVNFSSRLKEIPAVSLIETETKNDITINIPNSVNKISYRALYNSPELSEKKMIFRIPQWMKNGVESNNNSIIYENSLVDVIYYPDPDGKEYYAVWESANDENDAGAGYWVKTLKEDTTEETPTVEPTETAVADAE